MVSVVFQQGQLWPTGLYYLFMKYFCLWNVTKFKIYLATARNKYAYWLMIKAKKSAGQTAWLTEMFNIIIFGKITKNGTQIPDRFYSILLDLPEDFIRMVE